MFISISRIVTTNPKSFLIIYDLKKVILRIISGIDVRIFQLTMRLMTFTPNNSMHSFVRTFSSYTTAVY